MLGSHRAHLNGNHGDSACYCPGIRSLAALLIAFLAYFAGISRGAYRDCASCAGCVISIFAVLFCTRSCSCALIKLNYDYAPQHEENLVKYSVHACMPASNVAAAVEHDVADADVGVSAEVAAASGTAATCGDAVDERALFLRAVAASVQAGKKVQRVVE